MSGDMCEDTILEYLTKANRPYSVNDVHNNLQKTEGFTKPAVTKAMDNLVIAGKLKEKVYGKQKIFFIDQTTLNTVSDEELKSMDEVIANFQHRLNEVNASLKPLETRLAQCKRGLTLLEIRQETAGITDELTKHTARLEAMRAKMNDLDPKENETVKRQRNILVNEWRKRKRMALGALDAILDNCPRPKKAMLEEIGIETDEDAGAEMPKN